jgi:hypothetical protein
LIDEESRWLLSADRFPGLGVKPIWAGDEPSGTLGERVFMAPDHGVFAKAAQSLKLLDQGVPGVSSSLSIVLT